MHKVIFGIFAHPDDEAFGPAGSLLMEKEAGNEVHLLCATAGESGMNPDEHPNIAEIRIDEWKKAGALIGADSMHQLGYRDGTLQNSHFHAIAERITEIVTEITRNRDDIEIEFMSIDLNGITGHMDHICIARIACYVYCTMHEKDSRVGKMRLACVPREYFPEANCNWLYMDAGRTPEEIGETVDASRHLPRIRQIVRAHHSQRHDGESHLSQLGDTIAINHFIVLN